MLEVMTVKLVELGVDSTGDVSSGDVIKRGVHKGCRRKETSGTWHYLSGYNDEISPWDVKCANKDWADVLSSLGHRVGTLTFKGTTVYYLFEEHKKMTKQVNYDDNFFDDGRQYFARGLPAWKDYVMNTLHAESLADFGCGQGDWLEPFQGTIPIWGCDGYADENNLRIDASNFRKIDIGTVDPKSLDVGERDVCMSLEAMEHVTNNREANFLDCLLAPNPRLVVFSVAAGWGTYDPNDTLKINRLGERLPGGPNWHPQWGRHHVNCQPVECVIEKMKARGYVVDDELSALFANLKAPGLRGRPRLAFASFYRKNTRVYRKA